MKNNESATRIEPCLFGENIPAETSDLVIDLVGKSSILNAWLNPKTAESLSSIVRMMNCYYSNLIEGHNTKLQDIERALNSDFEDDDEKRNLQFEALAHIELQSKIDQLHMKGKLGNPTSIEFILWLHKEFYNNATEEMLTIKSDNRSILMEAGSFRSTNEHDVVVGRHIPPSGQYVLDFMNFFEDRYNQATGGSRQIMAIASAHHRLAYIHPFLDGNGRVCRLMSHAMGLKAGIGASGLWSISRGLARGLEAPEEYKRMMSLADMKRQGDFDGRGSLSLRALVYFTDWFLKLSIDQVDFMTSLFELHHLKRRLESYVKLKDLKPESMYILEAVLSNGEIPRGDAVRITGLKERSARTVLSKLTEDGILSSDTPKGSVSLRFDLESSRMLFPKLFSDFILDQAEDNEMNMPY